MRTPSLQNRLQIAALPDQPADQSSHGASLSTDDLITQGKQLYQADRFGAAVQIWQQALQGSADADATALIWSYLAAAYRQMGQWQQARQAIARSLQAIEQTPSSSRLRAQILTTAGHLKLAQHPTVALDLWKQAEALYRQSQDSAGQLGSQINQVRALEVMGFYRQARLQLETMQQALAAMDDANLEAASLKAMGLRQLGNVLRGIGDLAAARQALEQSLATAEAANLTEATASTLLSLGNTAQLAGNWTEALDYYRQAKAGAGTTQLQAAVSEFGLLTLKGQSDLAQAQLPKIQSQLSHLPVSQVTVYAQISLSQTLLSECSQQATAEQTAGATAETTAETTAGACLNLKPAAEQLAMARQQARELGDGRAESYAVGSLGRAYEATQQWQIAQDLTQQALLLAQTAEATDLSYQWQWQLGRIQLAQGQTTEAIAFYQLAVSNLRTLRGDLTATPFDLQFSFRQQVEPLYRELVTLLLGESGSQPSPDSLQQVQQVLDSLQVATVENFLRQTCLDLPAVAVAAVDATAAVIYPILLSDRLAIILALPGQPLRYRATFLPKRQVEQVVQAMRQSLRRTAFETEYLSASQRVYDLFLRPIAAELTESGVQTLVFTLDSPLQNLPVAALHDGRRFLVEQYNLALTPGLRLLAPQPVGSKLKALIGGVSQANQGFAALTGVETELTEIAAALPAEVLLNQNFTRSRLQAEINAAPFSVVHLATHGQFSSDPEQTFLLAWNDRITVRQLDTLLSSRDVTRPQPIELLVLSACETATGDQRAVLGLAGVAIRSGARSTLASLWLANDAATTVLMKEFYQNLVQGMSKAAALRQAQLTLLHQPLYRQPYYWAAFVLLGNWL